MAKITYKNPDGTSTIVDVPAGRSVMRGAVANGVTGVLAECGGGGICATCHIYVDEENRAPLPPMDELEDELLEVTASPRQPNSRLACQIPVTDAIDGLVVIIPEKQL